MRLLILPIVLLFILSGCAALTPTPTESAATLLPTVALTPTEIAAAVLPTVTPKPTETVITFGAAQMTLALVPVIDGLQRPTYLTHAGDGSGRLFIIEKPGRIRVFTGGQLQARPFLDITDRVGSNSNEQGLLGMAFAPDYETSGLFWVNYTDKNGDTVIARFQVSADPDTADPASEFVVMTIAQPAPNHNGGMLTFGPDGYMWIGMGDGGAANDLFQNGQNPASLLGKMLRLDVLGDTAQPYTIPADNPWVDADWNGADVRDEIWAVGLRNPWRFSFDRQTGDLWIADVGQNQWEEVNFTPATGAGGLNYGWPIMEATHCTGGDCNAAGLEMPILEYGREGGCSITGGYVYRGQAFPALIGVYLYADYCSGEIWAAAPDSAGGWNSSVLLQTNLAITSFGEDENGELYIVDDGGGVGQLTVE